MYINFWATERKSSSDGKLTHEPSRIYLRARDIRRQLTPIPFGFLVGRDNEIGRQTSLTGPKDSRSDEITRRSRHGETRQRLGRDMPESCGCLPLYFENNLIITDCTML